MIEKSLRPAHLGWRVAQSLSDDLPVTAIALCFAAVIGILPDGASMRDLLQSYRAPIDLAKKISRLLPTASLVYAVYWLAKLAYQTGFLTFCNGQTPGCWLFKVRVVMQDGRHVTWRAAVGRTLAGGVMGQAPVVGQVLRFIDYAATLFNRRRQAVRDMAAGTMLVHAGEWRPLWGGSANG